MRKGLAKSNVLVIPLPQQIHNAIYVHSWSASVGIISSHAQPMQMLDVLPASSAPQEQLRPGHALQALTLSAPRAVVAFFQPMRHGPLLVV